MTTLLLGFTVKKNCLNLVVQSSYALLRLTLTSQAVSASQSVSDSENWRFVRSVI